jgi:hypothetical protein
MIATVVTPVEAESEKNPRQVAILLFVLAMGPVVGVGTLAAIYFIFVKYFY